MCKEESSEREILESTITLLNKYLNEEIEMDAGCFKFIISDVLYYWVYKNKVGERKDKDIRIMYNNFFKVFLDILLKMKNSKDEEKSLLANKCLYQGDIYRTIGHKDYPSNIDIKIDYDDLYTHWSKKDTRNIVSIESEIYRNKKYLKTTIDNNHYGIYIAPFIGMKKDEEEVVFPLYGSYKNKIDIESIYLEDDEYEEIKLNKINPFDNFPRCRCLESLLAEWNYDIRNRRTC